MCSFSKRKVETLNLLIWNTTTLGHHSFRGKQYFIRVKTPLKEMNYNSSEFRWLGIDWQENQTVWQKQQKKYTNHVFKFLDNESHLVYMKPLVWDEKKNEWKP